MATANSAYKARKSTQLESAESSNTASEFAKLFLFIKALRYLITNDIGFLSFQHGWRVGRLRSSAVASYLAMPRNGAGVPTLLLPSPTFLSKLNNHEANGASSEDAKCQFGRNRVIDRKVLYVHLRTLETPGDYRYVRLVTESEARFTEFKTSFSSTLGPWS